MPRPREFDENTVIARATNVFWELGYRRTTPHILMEATGLSKSSLYGTFGTKQELFEICLERYVQHQEVYIKSLLANTSLRDGLASIYAGMVAMVTREEGPSNCLVCSTAIEMEYDEGSISHHITNARERLEAIIAERIALAQQAGDMNADRDATVVAQFLYSVYMGIGVLGRAGATAQELNNVVNLTLDTVCA